MTTKKWSVVPFGVILIAFSLPFVTFSCEGTRLLTLTGFQLVTGTTVERPSWGLFGERQSRRTERINPDGRAIIAFGGALVGFLLSLPGLIGRVDVQRQEGAWTALRALLAVVILVSLLCKGFHRWGGPEGRGRDDRCRVRFGLLAGLHRCDWGYRS